MTETTRIVAEHVTVTCCNGLTALHDASFPVPRGSLTALMGANGAGKSTLFKAVMGFVPAARGRIAVLGPTVREAQRKNLIAYVPQAEEVDWTFPLLVGDVVMMGRYGRMGFLRRLRSAGHAAVTQARARTGTDALRHRQIGELSGGQRKRVFLARALAQEAPVILLDEPSTGVDVQTEEQIIALLRELRAAGGDAGLDAQSRLGAGILRPGGAGQGHGAGRGPDGRDLHPRQSGARLRRRAAQVHLEGCRPS